jgi:hypothetical protein
MCIAVKQVFRSLLHVRMNVCVIHACVYIKNSFLHVCMHVCAYACIFVLWLFVCPLRMQSCAHAEFCVCTNHEINNKQTLMYNETASTEKLMFNETASSELAKIYH